MAEILMLKNIKHSSFCYFTYALIAFSIEISDTLSAVCFEHSIGFFITAVGKFNADEKVWPEGNILKYPTKCLNKLLFVSMTTILKITVGKM